MAHHLGAMIPFFDARIDTGWATLGSRTSGEDYSHVLPSLGKPLLDCFKDFYGDTALCGGRAGRSAGSSFYGVDHVLYRLGRAVRSGGRRGLYSLQMAAVASLDIPCRTRRRSATAMRCRSSGSERSRDRTSGLTAPTYEGEVDGSCLTSGQQCIPNGNF